MRLDQIGDLWFKNAVVLCVDVETYLDSDGDGVGDFGGLTRQLDYIAGLGVTCLWLMPFYPSPDRDDGYDISDFYGGTRGWAPSGTSPTSSAPLTPTASR